MDVTLRPLTADDSAAAYQLGRLAFGGPAAMPERFGRTVPGTTRFGAFDRSGRLVGKATDVGHEQWWSGRRVVAADVGGVAVAPEVRGGGVARALLVVLLRAAHERGAAVSALHPTVSAVYRSAGWEFGGRMLTGRFDTASLPTRREPDVTLRSGDGGDRPRLTELYERSARRHNGLLTRRGGFFDLPSDNPLGEDVDVLTVAEVDGEPLGALAFGRGEGYGPEATLDVADLLADRPSVARALVGVLAGWRTVTRSVLLSLPADDAVAAAFPLERATDLRSWPWMHRPVDVVRAVAERGWPPYVAGRVAFSLTDELAPWNSGDWELSLDGGVGTLVPATGTPDRWLTVRGFAGLYCGVATGAGLVAAGLAGGAGDPAALDLLGCGPAARLADYF